MDNLNPSQKAAVDFAGSYLLIVAGPGTGKTHTLTRRVARVAASLPPGRRVLAMTFTNKAAGEMRERLSKDFPDIDERLTVGTFHRFCLTLLKEYHQPAGLPADFRVAAPEEIETLAAAMWPQRRPRERRIVLEGISRWKAARFGEQPTEDVRAYDTFLRERHWLDFDDLLVEAIALLSANTDVREKVAGVYRDIFVDEYQDINAAQHALLRLLVGDQGRLTAIGDPNQAIYGFRGAQVGFFESFPEDFPGAEVLPLSENYRSAQNLLSASGQMIAGYQRMAVPELTARIYTEGRLVIAETPTDKAEAEYVVHSIEKMVGGTSMFSRDSGRVDEETGERSFGDIAVLYRLNSQGRLLEEALERSGIPYEISGRPKAGDAGDLINDFYFDRAQEAERPGEKVVLMSLHGAKGLEFPVVFIVGCEQTLLPLDLEGMTADVEEERRLFYVGMTRAKEQLVLLRARRRRLYGKAYTNPPSVFLSDIEEGLKEYERTAVRPKKRGGDEQMRLFK